MGKYLKAIEAITAFLLSAPRGVVTFSHLTFKNTLRRYTLYYRGQST